MKVISCYTPNLRSSVDLFRAQLKAYAPDHILLEFEPEAIKTYCTFWPRDRFFYACPRGGEFLDFAGFLFKPGEVICWMDVDFVPVTILYDYPPEEGEFIAFREPTQGKLNDVVKGLLLTRELLTKGSYVDFPVDILIAHKEDWQKLRDAYVPMFRAIRYQAGHHRLSRWLINHLLQSRFKLRLI